MLLYASVYKLLAWKRAHKSQNLYQKLIIIGVEKIVGLKFKLLDPKSRHLKKVNYLEIGWSSWTHEHSRRAGVCVKGSQAGKLSAVCAFVVEGRKFTFKQTSLRQKQWSFSHLSTTKKNTPGGLVSFGGDFSDVFQKKESGMAKCVVLERKVKTCIVTIIKIIIIIQVMVL